MGIKDVIREQFADLTPALRDVAKFVLDRPNDVVTVSMRTVAQRSDTKPPTLVRFAQHFGFKGWPELKAALASDMGLGPEQYGERAKTLVGRAKDQTLVSEMFKVHRMNLEFTERQNEGSLQRVCGVLEKAQAVHVSGFRACFPVAFSLTYVYRLFRNSVYLIDGQGGSLEMQLRAIGKTDAVVVISFAPYSREAVTAAQAAKKAGCDLIAITDSEASPISLLADETILFAIHSPSFFPSVTSAMAVTEGLVEMLASRAGKAVVRRIDLSETDLFESGAYVQAPRLRPRS